MDILFFILIWYGIGVVGSFITLWSYFYEDGLTIEGEDIVLGLITAGLGPINLLLSLVFLMRWVFKKFVKFPTIRIRKEK